MSKLVTTVVLAVVVCSSTPAFAQSSAGNTSADTMQVLREKIKADKKFLVAANMDLTEAEAKEFWPLYEAYQKDLEALNKRTAEMIKFYAEAWNAKSLDNEKAKKLTSEFVAIVGDEAKLVQSYAPKLGKVLPAVKVALYLQLENKIRTLVKFDLATQVPLLPGN